MVKIGYIKKINSYNIEVIMGLTRPGSGRVGPCLKKLSIGRAGPKFCAQSPLFRAKMSRLFESSQKID